jgi:hypothetical protein
VIRCVVAATGPNYFAFVRPHHFGKLQFQNCRWKMDAVKLAGRHEA